MAQYHMLHAAERVTERCIQCGILLDCHGTRYWKTVGTLSHSSHD